MRAGSFAQRLLILGLTASAAVGCGPGSAARSGPERPAGEASGGPAGSAAGSVALPVVFEPNEGQAPAEFDFVARAGSYAVGLSSSGATFVAMGAKPDEVEPRAFSRMRLVGASPTARPVGETPFGGASNYLRGANPEAWVRSVPHFGRVTYADVYPGIDWVFRGDRGVVAYDFVVGAGADPLQMRWTLEGAEDLRVDERGNLIAAVGGERLVHRAPLIFQDIDGRRRTVDGGFVIDPCAVCGTTGSVGMEGSGAERARSGSGRVAVGIWVGDYNRAFPLVVDPAIGFSTYLGGMASEDLPRIALDGDDNIYIVGTTASPDFPTTVAGGESGSGPAGGGEVFVTKLDSEGTTLVYSTYIGGSGLDRGGAISVDRTGGAWITGVTTSADFPVAGALQASLGGPIDAFVARLSADGSSLEYATFLGGSNEESGAGIAVDGAGNVWVIGSTASEDFPTERPLQDVLGGPSDAFVAKLDARGRLLFSTFLGGVQGNDTGFGITVDVDGNAFVTGSTESAAFPVVQPMQPEFGGGSDAFVAKLDAERPALLYATTLGGSAADAGLAIAVDVDGSAHVTGQTLSGDFPTRDALQPTPGGLPDAFVTKLNPQGSATVYSTFLGGDGVDVGAGIAIDGSGNVHVTGMTASADFPTQDSLQPFFGGGSDVFVSRINDAGSGFTYSTYSGGGGAEAGIGIVVDGSGNAYVVGQTSSPDFPTFNPIQADLFGPQDVFLTKYCLSLIFPEELEFGSSAAADRVTVTTAAGCAWIAFSQSAWISLTSPNAVAGSAEVEFAVAANPTGAERVGTINVGGSTFTIRQAEAQVCDARISPTSENFYMIGGVGRIRVNTTDDCSWTAISTVDWISIQGGDKGVGDGVVSYTVEMNGTGRQRAGTIIVAGMTFVVFDWIR